MLPQMRAWSKGPGINCPNAKNLGVSPQLPVHAQRQRIFPIIYLLYICYLVSQKY